jgi:hypothetical protein
MQAKQRTLLITTAILIIIAVAIDLLTPARSTSVEVEPTLTAEPVVTQPPSADIPNNALKQSILAAGDYLVRQQLPNGELSYQVDFQSGARQFSPSSTRLISGSGALYTVCRISQKDKYCDAGDLALQHYLPLLITDPNHFAGACLYTSGTCELGGSALAVDAIYKRWRAKGDLNLNGQNLKNIAVELGRFILSMRKPEGGFYHAFDPYYDGTVDPNYYSISAPGQSLLALTELYEMTGNKLWLTQAHEVNAHMITQPITEDHWHGYALAMLARLDKLTKADQEYTASIAQTVIDGGVRSLSAKNSSIASATKIEALASLAQALFLSGQDAEWLEDDTQTFITFVRARQLPANNCDWSLSDEMTERYGGGIFSACDDPSIRVDGQQHYIDGITAWLEYQAMSADK